MYIDLWTTLKKIEDQLPEDKTPEPAQLEKAYALTLHLRSQLIAVQYVIEQILQIRKRCRYLHQTHFISSHRRRQKLK